MGDVNPVKSQNCAATHPEKPFCQNNACTAEVDEDSSCAVPLRCTAEGYFPSKLRKKNNALDKFIDRLVFQQILWTVRNTTSVRDRRETLAFINVPVDLPTIR